MALLVAIALSAISNIQAENLPSGASKLSPLEQTFYDSGKVWVVVAVAGVILLGIFAYLIRMERTIRALEKEVELQFKKA